jgi:hypothetical protein
VLDLDLVLGWGKVPFAVQNLPTTGMQAITYSRSDATPSSVQSFVFGGRFEMAKRWSVGARLPFSFASFSPDSSAPRSTTAFGNLELAGEYRAGFSNGAEVTAALGVALPTAQGDEIPVDLQSRSTQLVDASAYDRFSLSRAAALARGYEENALFEPKRLGIVPKIVLRYARGALAVEPSVKVENLVGTASSLDAGYVGDLVAALRVGYRLRDFVEIALRGWTNVGYAGSDQDKTVSVAVEPSVFFRFGALRPSAGVVVPVAGPPLDGRFVGVRVGLAGVF